MNPQTSQDVKKETFGVNGMTCASCAVSLETWLKSKPGVVEASVNYPNQAVTIRFNPGEISEEQIDKAAKEIMTTFKFKTNINCENCIRSVTPFLNELDDVDTWSVDIENSDKILTVEAETDSVQSIEKAITESGFEAERIA